MGYTHHFEFENDGDQLPDEVVAELKELCEKTEVPLCAEYGSDLPPLFSPRLIRFNGVAENGCDDFILDFQDSFSDFCKTARKPYDLPVCICLLVLSIKFPGFSFSGDGIWGDGEWDELWSAAVDYLIEKGYPRESLESCLESCN